MYERWLNRPPAASCNARPRRLIEFTCLRGTNHDVFCGVLIVDELDDIGAPTESSEDIGSKGVGQEVTETFANDAVANE